MEISNYLLIPGIFVFFIIVLYYIPLGLWFTALVSGVEISLIQIMLMRFRKTPPAVIIRAMIMAHQAGVSLERDQLEVHYLSGGNVDNVVSALIAAKKAGLNLTFKKATAADLAGIDLLDAVKTEIVKQEKEESLFE